MRRSSFAGLILAAGSLFFAVVPAEAQVTKEADVPPSVLLEKNVAYLPDGRTEKADLYLPKNRGPNERSPAVVIIHGGGWSGGKKDAAREINIGTVLATHGYVGLSIEYLLATDAKPSWPQNIHDCKTAVRWLRANAKRLQIDVDHIGCIGGSAGGHLSALLALTGAGDGDGLNPKEPYGDLSCAVQCCVDMYGATEFEDGESAKRMLGKTKVKAPELHKAAYLTTHIDKNDPPFLILHGTADRLVPVAQSEMLAAALDKADVPGELLIIEGAPHSFHLQPAQQDLRPVVLRFFDKHLKPKP